MRSLLFQTGRTAHTTSRASVPTSIQHIQPKNFTYKHDMCLYLICQACGNMVAITIQSPTPSQSAVTGTPSRRRQGAFGFSLLGPGVFAAAETLAGRPWWGEWEISDRLHSGGQILSEWKSRSQLDLCAWGDILYMSRDVRVAKKLRGSRLEKTTRKRRPTTDGTKAQSRGHMKIR